MCLFNYTLNWKDYIALVIDGVTRDQSTISLRLRCIRSECRRAHRKKKKNYGSLVECYRKRKSELFEENPILVPFRAEQILHELAWDRTQQ
jgi:hypothetical protein